MTVSDSGSTPMILGGDGMGMGGGGFIWAFLIFALLFGGFGNRGGGDALAMAALANSNRGYDTQYATSNEVQRGFDNQNSMANQREILAAVNAQGQAGIAATNQSFHDMIAYNSDKYNEITRDIGALSVAQAQLLANQNSCCCETKMEIAQNRYDAAMNTAAINANSTAIGQKILDKLSEGENRALQNRVNQLELAQALTGVPRYQPGITYGSVPSPFFNGNPGFGGYPIY